MKLCKVAIVVVAFVAFVTACAASSAPEPAERQEPAPSSQVGTPLDEDATEPDRPVMVSVEDLIATGVTREQATCYVDAGDPGGTGFVTEPEAALEAFGSCLLANPPQSPGGG